MSCPYPPDSHEPTGLFEYMRERNHLIGLRVIFCDGFKFCCRDRVQETEYLH